MTILEVAVGLLVGGVLLVLYLIYKHAYAPYQFLKKHGIKGPPPTPFLGHYKDTVKMNAMEYDRLLIEKYGSVCGYYIGKQAYIVISDLDMLKQILVKDFDNFSDHAPMPISLSEGEPVDLFSSKGNTWRDVRKTLSPSFSASKMKMMLPLIKKSTDNLVAVVGDKAASEESFELFKVYSSFALEAILATAFGRRVDIQRGESDDFSKAMATITSGFTDGQIEQLLLFNSHFPWMQKLMRLFLGYTEAGKSLEYLKKVALDLIKSRRETGHKDKFKDILQLMIEAADGGEDAEKEEEEEEQKESKPPVECPAHGSTKPKKVIMSDEAVYQNSLGFLGAGNDTTAFTLSFSSYLLAVHPDIQEKLQSEIDAYFDDKPEANLYVAAQEITYLEKVIQECLRLYPPAVITDRYCKVTTVVNGVTLPAGAVIVVPVAYLHHSPEYWKDPEEFNPERFTAEEKAKRPQLCHMPFGFGPRSCIGMRLALLEIKIALIELLRKYTFIKAPDTEVPPKLGVGVFIMPKNGIYLKVINRA